MHDVHVGGGAGAYRFGLGLSRRYLGRLAVRLGVHDAFYAELWGGFQHLRKTRTCQRRAYRRALRRTSRRRVPIPAGSTLCSATGRCIFINDSISLVLWQALGSSSGNEPVDNGDF